MIRLTSKHIAGVLIALGFLFIVFDFHMPCIKIEGRMDRDDTSGSQRRSEDSAAAAYAADRSDPISRADAVANLVAVEPEAHGYARHEAAVATSFSCKVPDDYKFYVPLDQPFDMAVFQKFALAIDLCFDHKNRTNPIRIQHSSPTPSPSPKHKTPWWNLFDLLFKPKYISVEKEYKANPQPFLEAYSSLPHFTPEAAISSPLYRALFLPPHMMYPESTRDPLDFRPLSIPRDVHMIEYYEDAATRFFDMYKYINILSIKEQVKPDHIYFHCLNGVCGSGPWWELTKAIVTVVPVPFLKNIFGIPIDVGAHRTSILRLRIMLENGGIYLDSDILMVNSLEPLFEECRRGGPCFFSPRERQAGINNGILIGARGSPFIRRWMEMYRYFFDACWSCHGVRMALRIMELFPSEISMIPDATFLAPFYDELDQIFGPKLYDFSENYGIHLWCSAGACRKYLEPMTKPADMHRYLHNTTYGLAVQHALKNSPEFKSFMAMK